MELIFSLSHSYELLVCQWFTLHLKLIGSVHTSFLHSSRVVAHLSVLHAAVRTAHAVLSLVSSKDAGHASETIAPYSACKWCSIHRPDDSIR